MSSDALIKRLSKEKIAFLCVLPMLVIYLLFRIWPIFEALRLSVIKLGVLAPSEFIGLRNFVKLLGDEKFYYSMGRTLVYTGVSTAVLVPLCLAVALAVNVRKLRGKTLFKVLYFLPIVTATPVVGFVWKSMFDPMFGPVTHFLQMIGLPKMALLELQWSALYVVIFVGVWQYIGYYVVIFVANLQMIDQQLYEAAKIDGAGDWASFRHITLPLLKPAMTLVVLMCIIMGFQMFTLVLIMTGGGPASSTQLAPLYAYIQAFGLSYYEYGNAIAFALLVIIFIVAYVPTRVFKL